MPNDGIRIVPTTYCLIEKYYGVTNYLIVVKPYIEYLSKRGKQKINGTNYGKTEIKMNFIWINMKKTVLMSQTNKTSYNAYISFAYI